MNKTKYNQLRGEIENIYYKTFEYEKDGDITLEDCLIAVNGKDDHYGTVACDYREPNIEEFVKDGRGFSSNHIEEKLEEDYHLIERKGLGIFWELGKPLQDQSEETLTFLADLLL